MNKSSVRKVKRACLNYMRIDVNIRWLYFLSILSNNFSGEIDRVEATNVLEKGRILYYYRLAAGKLNKTKYGLCFLLKDKFEWFQMVSFIKPRKVKTILNHDHNYFFYSDLTLIDTPERVHYVSAIQEITEETVEYLLPFLLIRDWKYHCNDTPLISLEAFLHHIMSISANIFMIKRLSSLENIDWSFVDCQGNSFIHAACELKRNIDLARTIIDNAINKNQTLINMPNVENQTPLRLCLDKMNQNTRGDYSSINFVEYLIAKGATLIIHKNDSESMTVTNQFFISCLQVENHRENELIIAYDFPKKGSFRSDTYLYSKLNELDHCQITRTNKHQKKPAVLASILKEQFDLVLQTNCPQVIEYVFNPENELLSKSDRVTKHKDTMVHLTVRYANSVILQCILTGYERWNDTNEFGNNLLHTFIENYNSQNIKEKKLVSNIPSDHLNQLAFENRDRECLTCLVLKTPIYSLSLKNIVGCTPLQLAVKYSFVPAVELLLENSIINLNSQDNSGCNVLYNSIIHYHEVIFKMVLSAVLKFDVMYHSEDKLIDACSHQEPPVTPFLLSIQLNKLDATELLVSNGARIAKEDINPCSLLKFSKELDDLKRLFMIKVDGRNIPVLIRLTEIQDLEFNRSHILEFFYSNGEFKDFQKCLEALPITKIIKQNTELNTILHIAIENPFEEKLNFLLDQISVLTQSDERVLQLLNAINGKGETALSLAVKNSCHALARRILDIGANIETLYANKDNILHVSIHFGDHAMINILLTQPEIPRLFCRQNEDGNTPIHLLIHSGYIDEALVAIGRISSENLLGDDGEFLLMLAIELDNQRIQNTIFNRLPIESLLNVDHIQKRILYYAIAYQNIFSIQRLIRHNIDITVSDNSGKTAFHFAIDSRNDQIWKLLFEYLITFNEHKQQQIINIPNLKYPNLFQYSIIQNYFPAVKDLLKLRPNLFITDHVNGDTIIHLATKLPDCVPILKYLLNQINREDVDSLLQSTNSLNLPPLHYAVHCDNTEALKLFQRFNLKIAVPFEGNFVFFNKLFSDKLVLCKHLQTPPNSTRKPFLYGYKVNSPKETIFILTDIPHLRHCKLYQQTEVEVVHRVNEEELSILLQVPNTDPLQILILKKIVNLENCFSNESTLLHQAARHSNCSIVNYLFKYRGSDKRLVRHMDIFALDNIGNSILFYAMQNSNEQNVNEFLACIVRKILEHLRANPQHPNILDKENANSKRTLEVCFDLNKFDAFKCMLDPSFQIELTYEDSDGCTLLHKIVKGRGDKRFLEALLDEIKRRILQESFAKYLNHPTRDLQQTALHLCILKNQIPLLNLISKYSPNFLCKDKDGNTPLHLATNLKSNNEHSKVKHFPFWVLTNLPEMEPISYSNFATIKPISAKLTEDELKKNKISIALSNALLYSLDNESIEYFNFLLSHNLCLNAQYGVEKDSLLHAMIKKEKSNEFLALFLNTVCEYETKNKEKILIKGEPLIDARNAESLTPLALCIANKQERILNFLLTHKPSLTALSDSGNSILHYVATAGDEAISEIIFSKILNSPANTQKLFNIPNQDGCIPLHLAVEKGNVKLSEMFLNNGSKFYSQDYSKRTLLHHAIENPDQILQSSMIEFILTYEQNNEASHDKRIYEICDVENSIPFYYAIQRGSLSAVKLLVPFPSTLNHRNSNNHSALHLVSMKSDNDIFDEVFNHISNQERNRDDLDCIACCKDKQGLTALEVCIKQQNEHARRKLAGQTLCLNLSTCQLNPNLNEAFIVRTDYEIQKTLNEVFNHNSELILQAHLYLENKNNVVCFQDYKKPTTMYSAIYYNYSHAFDMLLKTSSFVNILDDNDET